MEATKRISAVPEPAREWGAGGWLEDIRLRARSFGQRIGLGRAYALVTAPLRALPDFLIVGAQKAGTTSLYAYLCEHPQVLGARAKEVHYFDHQYQKSALWYRSNFPTRWAMLRRRVSTGKRVLTCESSPYYLFHPHSCRRIARILPRARIIIMLRAPAERAYSHYQHNVRAGWETLPFQEAVAQEPARLAPVVDRILRDQLAPCNPHACYSYVSRGHYLEQVASYEAAFGRDHVKVISSEQFFAQPRQAYQEILEFLGLDAYEPSALREGRVLNAGTYPDDQAGTVQSLARYFQPFNERLFQYLGRRFDW